MLAVVIDQLGVDTFERLSPALPEDGFLRRARREGAFHTVRFGYAGTYTAPGHAAIHTGAPPAVSGIAGNQIYDRDRKKRVAATDVGAHPVLGAPNRFASPLRLRAETVADVLKRETNGRGQVVALAAKERGAILPGGKRPDLVLFYEPETRGYTTSSFYTEVLPPWVTDFAERHPLEDLLVPWNPELDDEEARQLGIETSDGTGDWDGFGAAPPHDPRAFPDPWVSLPILPAMTDHLFALARAAVEAHDLGGDDVPDLLSISIAGPDYAGHVFGPHSVEYFDHLRTADRALGSFVRWLEERTRVAVVVTSDHGVAPLPERMERLGQSAGRIDGHSLVTRAEEAATEALGEGPWVEAFVQPFLYFTERGRTPAARRHLTMAVRHALMSLPSIEAVFDVRDSDRLRHAPDALARSVGWSIDDRLRADLFLVPAKYFVVDEQMPPGKGTSHGTPWPYDTDVPFLAWGFGVRSTQTSAPLAQGRVASSIAALLGVEPPLPADPDSLPGITRRGLSTGTLRMDGKEAPPATVVWAR